MQNNRETLLGRDKANALVASFGSKVGVHDAILDSTDDRSFGECGFHYYHDGNTLAGRVFIAKAYLKNAPAKQVENFRKVAAALDDPNIGGLFEHNGGHFILDEDKEIYFLVKSFSVAVITSRQLNDSMEDLINLGATWRLRWFARVADITHGFEPAPIQPVTRKNDRR